MFAHHGLSFLFICFPFQMFSFFLSACSFSNESGSIIFFGSPECFFLSIWPTLHLFFTLLHVPFCSFSYFLGPIALSDPPLSVSLTGWASWELRLTFQLHFDLWPCCCRLLHLGHNSTCHSLTFHPLCSASHPAITTLPFFSSVSPLSGTYQGYRGYSEGKHSLHSVQRWKKGETERVL